MLTSAKTQNFWSKHKQRTLEAYQNEETSLPHRYVLVLTNLCNLRCSFCFQARTRRSDAMTKDDWLKFIDQVPSGSRLTLTGGEPLVFKGFKEIYSAAIKKCYVNIISNGVLLNDDFIEMFTSEKNMKVFSISIDDIGNKSRDFKDGQWQKLVTDIKRFNQMKIKKSSDVSLDIKAVIMNDNSKDLFKFHKFVCEELKADTTSFSFLKGADIQHNDFEFEFDAIHENYKAEQYDNFDTIIDQLEKIRKYNLDNNKFAFLHPNIFNLNDQNNMNKKMNINFINNIEHDKNFFKPCIAPWGSIHVNVDGNVFPCMAISMGNVKKQSLREIVHGKIFKNFKKIIKDNGTVSACNRCGYLEPAKK